MARFERSNSRSSRDRDSRPPRRDSGSRGSFGGSSRGRGSFDRGKGERRELEMTKVICSACNTECEVPFKPSSNKPVYCRDCFLKNEGRSSSRESNNSSHDFNSINRKLDKIMKALDID